jgi:hypothetical protein
MRKLELAAITLSVCLLASLLFSAYLYSRLLERQQAHHSTFFSFVFSPTMQNITTGNLYLNLTFDTYLENLTVKAKVNADNYDSNAVLALQFDSDNNGTIGIREGTDEHGDRYYTYFFRTDDLQFLLEANNLTLLSDSTFWGWYADGTIYMARSPPFSGWAELESSFHFCTYENGVYTFNFTFPVEPRAGLFGTDLPLGIQGSLVRALFAIIPTPGHNWYEPPKGMAVYVPPFNFKE